jgi:hypothetical protein
MLARTFALLAIACFVSGCMVKPEVKLPMYIGFDQPMPERTPMSYNDLLCCYQCSA